MARGQPKELAAMADDPNTPAPTPAPPAAPAPPAPSATPSATPAAPVAPPAPPAPDRPPGVSDAEWTALGDPGKAAIVRERTAATQAASELAALRKEIADSKLSAEEKSAADLKAAQDLAATNAAKALKYEIAAEHEIPLSLAARLTGTTREEIDADAAKFKTSLPVGATPPPRTPAPDPSQGPRPGAPASEDDQIYEAIYGTPR